MRQSMGLSQQMQLTQVVEFANLLAVPDEVLSAVAGAVSYNPGSIESILRERKLQPGFPNDNVSKVQNIYASLVPSKGDAEPLRAVGGKIIAPDIRALGEVFGTSTVSITPDVTYIGRREQKPELVLSDHLRGSMSVLLLQLDESQYPETSRLVSRLRRFDDWKRGTLRNAYIVIGEKQREFMEELDNTKLNIFKQEDLAEKLNLSSSTISRIFSNRWVEARGVVGEPKFMYAKDLLVTSDDLQKYLALPQLEEVLREEFERKEAYSDSVITCRVKGVARRTLSKYRSGSGIPNALERSKAYQSGSMTEPYKVG